LKNERGEHDFMAACREGNTEAVQFFLDLEGFDVNEPFSCKAYCEPVHGLFVAAAAGRIEVVQSLIAADAEINQTWGGITPLYVAAQNGHDKVVQMLLDSNANPFKKYRFYWLFTKSPLNAARSCKPWFRVINPAKYDSYTVIIKALKKAASKSSSYKPVTTHHSKAETERTPLLGEHSRLRSQPVSKQ
ncbi:ankyrin repeat domain-containing protein, partial [Sansalvadorimonas verongulae]|uniref:ankyrin repeat domain-containing protein n=1 Tax=Sansalvadorimonas verongulae TaxID=2172824 RepID=UPI001E3D47C3